MKWLARSTVIVILAGAVALAVYPLLWMGYSSLKSNAAIAASIWALPTSPTLANYREVWGATPFPRHFLNSVLVTGGALVVLTVVAALAGYGFARFTFRGKQALWLVFLAGLFLPIHVTLIPLARIEGLLGISRGWGSLQFLGLVYVAFNLSFSVFFLRGFFANVPAELVEAAALDGCGSFGVFWRILLPLSLPALLVTALVNFVMIWNEFMFALVLLPSSACYTLPVAVRNFADETGANLALTFTALTITVLPVVVLFAVGQKWIIRGMTEGALKG